MGERWPRMMKKATAVAYCDMSAASFEREITEGRLPAPVMFGGREHWCIKALDKALDAITGEADLPTYRQEFARRYG